VDDAFLAEMEHWREELARFKSDPKIEFEWNRFALDLALACDEDHVKLFFLRFISKWKNV